MRRRPHPRLWPVVVALALLAGCAGPAPRAVPQPGPVVEVLGPWTGVEQTRFTAVLSGFTRTSGVRVRYVSYAGRYLPDVLDPRLARGAAPDLALLPQPGMLDRYARAGRLVPLDAATRRAVAAHYPDGWRRLATVGGREYGVWFKAADKSLVWYDVAAFERAGVVPPGDLAGLVRLAGALAERRIVPFAVGEGDRWVLTDWFENIYLRTAGPAGYDRLAEHRIPWTDGSVTRALELLRRLLAPRFLLGGVAGAARTGFPASVRAAFGPPARAAMLAEGDFVAGFLSPGRRLGVDVDVFPFPGSYAGLPVVVGGGDVAVRFGRSAAAARLQRYLATPDAAQIWAAAGGYVSPNVDVDLQAYPAGVSRTIARDLVEAGDGFRFDLSDLEPPQFGSAPDSGLQAALHDFLLGAGVGPTQARLEAAARAAFR